MFAIPENRRRRRPAPTLLHCHKVEGLIVDVGRRAAVAEAVRCGLETFQVQGFHGRGEHLFEFSERQGEEQLVALNCSLRRRAKHGDDPTTRRARHAHLQRVVLSWRRRPLSKGI